MDLFDFESHYEKIKLAVTPDEITKIRQEYDRHFDSLSASEQDIFVLRLRDYMRQEITRTKALIDFVNEVLATEKAAV